MNKSLRDGSIQASVQTLVIVITNSLGVPSELAMAIMGVCAVITPYVYRAVRRRWPWLMEIDQP